MYVFYFCFLPLFYCCYCFYYFTYVLWTFSVWNKTWLIDWLIIRMCLANKQQSEAERLTCSLCPLVIVGYWLRGQKQGFLEIRPCIGGLKGFSRLVPRLTWKSFTTSWQIMLIMVSEEIIYARHMMPLNVMVTGPQRHDSTSAVINKKDGSSCNSVEELLER